VSILQEGFSDIRSVLDNIFAYPVGLEVSNQGVCASERHVEGVSVCGVLVEVWRYSRAIEEDNSGRV